MENAPEFTDALARLPFTPLGPTEWRTCHRSVAGHGYGPDAGLSHLSLAHSALTPGGRTQRLTVGVTFQPGSRSGADLDRAVRSAVMRMTTVNPDAAVTEQREQEFDVQGDEVGFRLVMLSDGQWYAAAETGGQFVTLGGTDWPVDALRLVDVDPMMYAPGVSHA